MKIINPVQKKKKEQKNLPILPSKIYHIVMDIGKSRGHIELIVWFVGRLLNN
jgi:hypothetical protein